MKRRTVLALLGATVLGPGLAPARAEDDGADDPAAPQGGNRHGDVLIVAFFDYDCPYCKRAEPELQRFVAADGGVRLVYADWPVLGEASVRAARLALAAAYQGRYEAAHRALMALRGRRTAENRMREALEGAGIDLARLDEDARGHADAITARLAGNAAQATSLGLQAVPAFLIGGRQVVGGFDLENFQEFAARARGGRAAPAR